MTYLGELNTLIIILAIIYWAVNKDFGTSFPSGHSTNGAALFGGIAIRKEMPKMLRGLSIAIMILIGFSRNFLGVHTPQDVAVGLVIGVLVMWLVALLMKWIDFNPEKDWIVLLAGILIAVAVAVYAGVKTYPEDYIAALIKDYVPGAAGTLISCFIRLFYVAFCFPCLIKKME